MILGFMLALRRCKKTGVEPDYLYNLVLWLIPVCILCARAYYVLFEWEQYKDNLLSVFQINKGGLAIYGHPRRSCCCTDLLQGQKAFLLVACRYADSQPCSWTSHRALGEFCESGGLRKSDHKSRSPILSVWCLHRGTRAVASGNVLLRICTEYNTLLLIVMLISYPHFRKKGYLLPFYMIGYGVIRCFVEELRTDVSI